MKTVLSYGGGVNSVALCVLVGREILPRPDFIVMADTGREATATWEYLRDHTTPYLAQFDLKVEIAPHDLATVDLWAHNGDLLIPVYTETGKLPTFCSSEWKEMVIRRQLRSWGVEECELWIGYAFDERQRMKPSRVKWTQRVAPLIEKMLTRTDCHTIIEWAGLPEPPKSACWMCSNRRNKEWRFLRDHYPLTDWKEAIILEREIQDIDPGFFLHPDRVPLDQADIDAEDHDLTYGSGQCGLGVCDI